MTICRVLGEIQRSLPENDIWIAALAMEHGLTLISRDEHFKKIDELKSATW
jgi:tRNA(fMet)-specific endonuclease VapC